MFNSKNKGAGSVDFVLFSDQTNEKLSRNSVRNRQRSERDFTTINRIRNKSASEAEVGAFFHQYDPLIKRIASTYKCAGCSEEDLYIAGCNGFMDAINNFKMGSSAFSTAVHSFIKRDMQREITRIKTDSNENSTECSLDVLWNRPSEDDVYSNVEKRDQARRIKEMVLNLHPKLRIVVICRFYAGKTLEETGKLLNITKEATRLRELKALSHLKHRMVREDMAV